MTNLARALGIALVVLTLLALLWYSQWRGAVEKVSGFVEAEEIRLGSRVGGRVAAVLVEEGSAVAPGQELFRLEEYDLGERLAEARAQLEARQAELARLKRGFRDEEKAQAKARVDRLAAKVDRLKNGPLPEEIEAAKARLELSSAQLELAQLNFRRVKTAAQRSPESVTQEEVDRVTQEFKAAQAAKAAQSEELKLLERGTREELLREAQAELEEARQAALLTTTGYRPEEIDQAAAAVKAAQAAEAAIETQRRELVVRAPSAGVIEAIDLRPGDLTGPGAPVVTMLDRGAIWVRAYIPEDRLDLKLGQKLRVTVDSFPGRDFTGEITFIARQAEFTPSNVQTPEERAKQVFRVKVALPGADPEPRPGVAADVWLP